MKLLFICDCFFFLVIWLDIRVLVYRVLIGYPRFYISILSMRLWPESRNCYGWHWHANQKVKIEAAIVCHLMPLIVKAFLCVIRKYKINISTEAWIVSQYTVLKILREYHFPAVFFLISSKWKLLLPKWKFFFLQYYFISKEYIYCQSELPIILSLKKKNGNPELFLSVQP